MWNAIGESGGRGGIRREGGGALACCKRDEQQDCWGASGEEEEEINWEALRGAFQPPKCEGKILGIYWIPVGASFEEVIQINSFPHFLMVAGSPTKET